jgi:hypothetical protein
VVVNADGAWAAETVTDEDGTTVMPICDEDGDYIPAPRGWEIDVIEQVEVG